MIEFIIGGLVLAVIVFGLGFYTGARLFYGE